MTAEETKNEGSRVSPEASSTINTADRLIRDKEYSQGYWARITQEGGEEGAAQAKQKMRALIEEQEKGGKLTIGNFLSTEEGKQYASALREEARVMGYRVGGFQIVEGGYISASIETMPTEEEMKIQESESLRTVRAELGLSQGEGRENESPELAYAQEYWRRLSDEAKIKAWKILLKVM